MTFDLHYSNDQKAEAFRIWVRRIYYVASTLNLSYLEMWELPEQEFLILEEMALAIIEERKRRKKELEESVNNGHRT